MRPRETRESELKEDRMNPRAAVAVLVGTALVWGGADWPDLGSRRSSGAPLAHWGRKRPA